MAVDPFGRVLFLSLRHPLSILCSPTLLNPYLFCLQQFLLVALENIRFNLGDRALSEHDLQDLQYNFVKNAAAQYYVPPTNTTHSPPQTSSSQPPSIIVTNSQPDSHPPTTVTTNSNDLRRSVLIRSSARIHQRRQRQQAQQGVQRVAGRHRTTSSDAFSDIVGLGRGGTASSIAPSSPPLSERPSPLRQEDDDLSSLPDEEVDLIKRRRLDSPMLNGSSLVGPSKVLVNYVFKKTLPYFLSYLFFRRSATHLNPWI